MAVASTSVGMPALIKAGKYQENKASMYTSVYCMVMGYRTTPNFLSTIGRLAVFRTDAVDAASGSAWARFGNTEVIVSVFGPTESKKAMMYSNIGQLTCNVSYTTFASLDREQGSNHREYTTLLYKALERAIILETFPKATVDFFALVLESGGSNLPVVITCASLALADAGIIMYDLVSSVSVSCLDRNLVLDPNLEEENCQDGCLMIACMPSRYEVTQLTVTGDWSTPKLNEGILLCLGACSELAKTMRLCLQGAASASSKEDESFY